MKIRTAIVSFLKALLICIVLCSSNSLMAQAVNTKHTIPPFKILLTDNTYLIAAELDKALPAMIVYFDPTCDHCKTFTADLIKHEKDFGKTQIILITYTPVDQVKKFAEDFHISRYRNIRTGTEGNTFIVQRYFNIQHFPFIALYSEKGMLIASYRDVPPIQELLLALIKS